MANWRRKARYLPGGSLYNYEAFCGACGLHVRNPSGHVKHIDDAEPVDLRFRTDREIRFIGYCPWCGCALDRESWRTCETEGLLPERHDDGRVGEHRGDEHILPGPFEPPGHMFALTCWCKPVIERQTHDGCVVRHRSPKRRRSRPTAGADAAGGEHG
jgi:hypothetical protein